jgi:hypothetical protein
MNVWQGIEGDRVVAFATWDSGRSWQASAAHIFAVVEDDPFDRWESGEIEVLYPEA